MVLAKESVKLKILNNDQLKKVTGGISLSGPILQAFNETIKILFEIGQNLGQSLKRLFKISIC